MANSPTAEQVRRSRVDLLADAKKGRFDIITTKLLADLNKAKEKQPSDSKKIDAIIARAKALEFHGDVEPIAMTRLVEAIQFKFLAMKSWELHEPLALADAVNATEFRTVIPVHFNHIYRSVLNGGYDYDYEYHVYG
jgi:hypothetical protein